jgi:proliferating cell nuclear antigen
MLKIFFYDAIRWRDLLNAISTLREEVEFKISPERMQLRAMDDSHTAMVDMDLSKDFFDKYQCDKSTDLRFNLNSVLNILQGVTSNESIAMMYDEEQARITINLRGEYERIFNLTK